MALTMPIKKAITDPVLRGQPNGALPAALLDTVDDHIEQRMLLLKSFALNMRALHFAARVEAGLHLDSTGRYRPLSEQYNAFCGTQARYEPCSYAAYLAAVVIGRGKKWAAIDRRVVADRLGHTVPNSTYWRKKKNPNGTYPATAAVPGTSDHGLGSADDLALRLDGRVVGLTAGALQWLYANAPRFSIFWAMNAEPWHVNDCSGGTPTPETLRYRNVLAAPSLTIGSTGPHVTMVQALMNNKGAGLVVDGQFGKKTQDAVRFFQGGWGQPQTGIVNADFWWMVGK